MIESRTQWNILAQAWKRAADTNDYSFVFGSYQEAMNMRARLYACIRRAKSAKHQNQELVNIANMYAVTVQGNKLIIYRKALSEGLQQLEAVLTTGEVNNSIGRLQELLNQGQASGVEVAADMPVNPYYTR